MWIVLLILLILWPERNVLFTCILAFHATDVNWFAQLLTAIGQGRARKHGLGDIFLTLNTAKRNTRDNIF